MKNKKQSEIDKAQLVLINNTIKYWEGLRDRYERAIKNGRCDECGEPLMFDENETCEDCLCPE